MKKEQYLHLACIIAIAAFFRVMPALNSANWTDLYVEQAYPILEHLNIYKVTHKIFPYSPVSMFLPALCAFLSYFFKVPFHIFMRFPAIAADIGINIALYVIMLRRGQKTAMVYGLFYAVNPVSILISSFHGNMMMIAVLFTLLAYKALLDAGGIEKNYRRSALFLGLAIGFRSYAILLLPFFVLIPELKKEKKIKYILYALMPSLISFIPFLILDAKSVIREILFYSGWPDHGFLAIVRAVGSLKAHTLQYSVPYGFQLMAIGKYLFIVTYLFMLFLYKRKKVIVSIASVFLAFYFLYPGVSSQYLSWILPFAFLMEDKYLGSFVILGAISLLVFYALYHPYIILGRWADVSLYSYPLVISEIVFLSAFWILCPVWGFSLLNKNRDRKTGDMI